VSEHDATPVVPVGLRVQLALEKLPLLLEEKLTVPVGFDFVPESVSVTVAVQVVWSFRSSEAGLQLVVVEVVRLAALTPTEPLLVAWAASPASLPVIVWLPVAVGV
jgi:hypothetical protein